MPSIRQKKRRYPFKRQLSRKLRRFIFICIATALAGGINYYQTHSKSQATVDAPSKYTTPQLPQGADAFSSEHQQHAIEQLHNAKNSPHAQFWVGFNAKVVQILKDDNQGSRHQKFIVRPNVVSPNNKISLLVAHNIDLAARVPISVGQAVSIYGLYEWNHRGGVIHWTHHDPKGKKQGGWIVHNKKAYR